MRNAASAATLLVPTLAWADPTKTEPSTRQMISGFGAMAFTLFLLWFCVTLFTRPQTLLRSMLTLGRGVCIALIVTGPIYMVMAHDARMGIALLAGGIMGLLAMTLVFWREFFPPRNP